MTGAIALILLGALVLVLTLTRPGFFWERGRSRTYRGLIGDRATLILYIVTGLILLGLGIYRLFQAV